MSHTLVPSQADIDARFRHLHTIVVKVTHRCNLDCLYCYENITKRGEDMSLDTFYALARKVLYSTRLASFTFLFHGGEPTLLPNEWYEQAIAYARTLAASIGKQVHFSMQTNLLSLSEAKIELFQRQQIQLGISLDGTEHLDSQSMRGGETKVISNLEKLRTHGIKWGILTTINHRNALHLGDFCQYLHQSLGVRHFKANVITAVGRGLSLPSLGAEAVFGAQRAILEYMIAQEGQFTEYNLMLELRRFFGNRHQQPQSLCHERRCGAGEAVMGITPKGDLLPCGRFQWDDTDYYLGSLHQSDEEAFRWELHDFHHSVPQTWYDCPTCEAKPICSFGCQAFIVRSREQANVDCLPTKMRYQYYTTHRLRLEKLMEYSRRIPRLK